MNFVSDVTLDNEEDQEEEDELDRMVREQNSQSRSVQDNLQVPGIVNLNEDQQPRGSTEVLFQRCMMSFSQLANNMASNEASNKDRENLNKALSLLCETNKRRREDELEEEEPVMWDEMVHVKDDGHSVVDMHIRQKLRNPNCDPMEWWQPSVMEKISKPVIAQQLYLSHLMPGRVNQRTIRRFHDRSILMTTKALATANSGITGEKKMTYRLQHTEEDETLLTGGRAYQECKTCFDVVESVLNMGALTHQIRPYSFEAWSLLRAMHHVRYFYGVGDCPKTQMGLLQKFIGEVFGYNQRRGAERKSPASFKGHHVKPR